MKLDSSGEDGAWWRHSPSSDTSVHALCSGHTPELTTTAQRQGFNRWIGLPSMKGQYPVAGCTGCGQCRMSVWKVAEKLTSHDSCSRMRLNSKLF